MSKTLSVIFLLTARAVVMADLPTLPDKPWLGHFVGHTNRDYRFGVKHDGKMFMEIFNSKGTAMGSNKTVSFLIEVVEEKDGKQSVKQINAETLASTDKPTDKPEKISFTGKTTGDVEFVVFLEWQRDVLFVGGKITNPGKLTNPLKFQIRTAFRNVYSYTPKEKLAGETRKDRLTLATLEQKRVKLEVTESVDLKDEKIFGKGQTNIILEMKAFDNKRFDFSLVGPGAYHLQNARNGLASALTEGFSIAWQHDPEKDPEAKTRMKVMVK